MLFDACSLLMTLKTVDSQVMVNLFYEVVQSRVFVFHQRQYEGHLISFL